MLAPWRPAVGIAPQLTAAELVTPATMQAVLGFTDDDVRMVDSTPVECGRSREAVKRSDLAGRAEYGYCASHSRFFWGMRPHRVAPSRACPPPSP
ncbi:hypothetical protein SUDANB176_07290 [Streptomyces sp. enrichment culture]